jgi:hypothetical protein
MTEEQAAETTTMGRKNHNGTKKAMPYGVS